MKNAVRYFILLLTIQPLISEGQIKINEFTASNTGSVLDPDFNESADWIELYNSGTNDINLGGFFLTDNYSNPQKWKFPDETMLRKNSYLLIWADGMNTGLHTNFKLSADGEELALYNQSGALIDSVSFGIQKPNISMGRSPDGAATWQYFLSPTPGAGNSSEAYPGVVSFTPDFDPPGGIFENAVGVEIKNRMTGEMRYTLDGSEPNANSPLVNGPIEIDTTTIIRCRIFMDGYIPGPIVTQSYFIDSENQIGSLPVVSISSDPENFWDSENGIYVQDYKPDREVPVNIELFENDGSDRAGFNEPAGIKVNGLNSWQLPQKMLGVYFRKEYGKGKLDYPLLFDHDRKVFDSFALRASGSDWAYTLFRDGMIQSLTKETMDVDFQGFRACVVFINGKYMGIHNIRSKVDEDFVVENHNLGDRQFDMVENENFAEAGSLEQYKVFETLYQKDLSVQANYDAVENLMDIENFTDFIITEIYSQNSSVNHNIMAWKTQDGGKWKWILNDLDRGFFNAGNNLISFYAGQDVVPLKNLLLNDGYREYFGKRLADHLFTTFNPERVKSIIDEFKTNIQDEIPKHIERWKGTGSSYGNPISSIDFWLNEIEKMKSFAESRPPVLLNDLQNYGFNQSLPLSVSVYPEKTGTIVFNGIEISQSSSQGAYPENEEVSLFAKAKGGSVFKGWSQAWETKLVAKEEIWKYNDSGNSIDNNWSGDNFDDSGWSEGQAELGYGDGDENTATSFGSDSHNKIITTYFRKNFTLENTSDITGLKLSLKCDDGAVIYINGTEVARENLPAGQITASTTALTAIGGSDEDNFTTYSANASILKSGKNVVAVEVHQANSTSSDISFDLELSATKLNTEEFISTDPDFTFIHDSGKILFAVFESDGSCVLPEEITSEMTLSKSCSPYRVPDNVLVKSSGKLIINPGVELWISDDVSIEINGSLYAKGTPEKPVIFKSNPESPDKKWGILNFVNADSSSLKNVVIEDASKGYHPLRETAAVSVFNSVLNIYGATIENVYENPVVARYSDVTIVNSRFYSNITGDLINLKYGKGYINNCEFTGNDQPDTDAIDYDDISNGVIRNCMIHDFYGTNSDAIDIGEKAKNILIQNVAIYNVSDKGISVGQQSLVSVSNSVFVNCNMGAGIKDSSQVNIDHCTYYGDNIPIACYEKNQGDAGGNAMVTNTILSNACETSYLCDNRSTILISNSASDNESLPAGKGNIFGEPDFVNPNLFNFMLSSESPCIGRGTDGNMGAMLETPIVPQLYISALAYNSVPGSEVNEFIELTNPGDAEVDISGYQFTKGITFIFPENSVIEAGGNLFIANNKNDLFWLNKNVNVYQWESGRLADEGETVQLETPWGIVADHVIYNSDDTWPVVSFGEGIQLKANNLDNHFGSNWELVQLESLTSSKPVADANREIKIYPNPTSGHLFISGEMQAGTTAEIFDITGRLIKKNSVESGVFDLDLSGFHPGVYLIRVNEFSQRIILK